MAEAPKKIWAAQDEGYVIAAQGRNELIQAVLVMKRPVMDCTKFVRADIADGYGEALVKVSTFMFNEAHDRGQAILL